MMARELQLELFLFLYISTEQRQARAQRSEGKLQEMANDAAAV